MTDDRHTEKREHKERSQGNLGQKQAKREETADETVATLVALARRLEKTPVVVRDGPGFLVNRILAPYLNEAGVLALPPTEAEQHRRAQRPRGVCGPAQARPPARRGGRACRRPAVV